MRRSLFALDVIKPTENVTGKARIKSEPRCLDAPILQHVLTAERKKYLPYQLGTVMFGFEAD